MTMPTETNPSPVDGQNRADELDRKLEGLLDESVRTHDGPGGLSEGFASKVAAARPFAPWEVRHGRPWRVPLGVGGLLLAGSFGIGLAPLWTLGPATALETWTDLVLAGSVRPVATLIEALPLLGRGLSRLASAAPPAWTWLLLLAGAAGAATLVRGRAAAAPGRGIRDASRG